MGGKSLEQGDTEKVGAMTQVRDEQGSDKGQGRAEFSGWVQGGG